MDHKKYNKKAGNTILSDKAYDKKEKMAGKMHMEKDDPFGKKLYPKKLSRSERNRATKYYGK